MALDGLGLVYEKQGNTGAAAYNNPVMEIGKNPLDYLAAQIREEGGVARKEKALKGKERDEANKKALFDLDISGSDYDNRAIFIQEANDLRKRGAELAMAGKDLRDYSDPDVLEWRRSVDRSSKAAGASLSQEKDFLTIRDEVAKNPENFDVDATMNALNAWYKMKPSERIDINPQDLKVRKYSPLAPLEKVDISKFIGETSYKGKESFVDYNKLDKKNLKTHIKTLVESGDYDKSYESNKAAMGWKSKEDYINYLYKDAESHFTQSRKSGVIQQPATDMSGMSFDQRLQAVVNTSPTILKLAEVSPSGQPLTDADGKQKTREFSFYNPQGITGVDVIIPAGNLIEAATNQRGIKTLNDRDLSSNYAIKSGNLGIALVNEYGQIVGDEKSAIVNTYDKKGKLIKRPIAQAIADGDVRYDVVLQGNAKVSGAPDTDTGIPSYVLADKAITPDLASKSDGMNDAIMKKEVLKQLAAQKNKQYGGVDPNSLRQQYGY